MTITFGTVEKNTMRGNETIEGKRIQVYDNGGLTIDRYTVCFIDIDMRNLNGHGQVSRHIPCLGMNGAPFHPQGFCQHSECSTGPHLGRRIPFATLPADCQKAVKQDIA